ncbi:MAG: multifunctional CCA tRNA nucleotidyl transferase/2'3'-cyclic phosphodiesterase/2'nucleotidase/phosphatase, partial [Gammaproteobacteria bacterium]
IFRNPAHLEPFLLACEADARGRVNFEDSSYPSAPWLTNLVDKLAAITTREFIEAGLTGIALGEAIDKRRLDIITAYKIATDTNA